MTKKNKGAVGNDETYTTVIEPIINKLKMACKAHNMPLLVAVDVPLTQNAGVCMLSIQPNRDGQVSTAMHDAHNLLKATPPATSD